MGVNEIDENINAIDLVRPIYKNFIFISLITSIFGILSIFFALSLSDIYKSDALVMVISEEDASMPSSLGQYSGLASLAGINIDGLSKGKNTSNYVYAKINSREFLTKFITERSLKQEIMATTGWDRVKDEFVYDKKKYNKSKDIWTRKIKNSKKAEPSIIETYEVFIKKNLSIVENENSGFYTISIKSYSPNASKNWLDWLIHDFNELIKKKDVNEANRSIEFLKGELLVNPNKDIKDLLNLLIQKETKTLALADSREEYSLSTVDRAYLPEDEYSPNRIIIVILGIILGAITSVIISYAAYARNKIIYLRPSFVFIGLKNNIH